MGQLTFKTEHEEPSKILKEIRRMVVEKEERNCAAFATKSSQSKGRKIPEDDNLTDNRTDFARDRDRIIYCSAFFKLSGKTQVFMSPRNPLISNRMTHVIQVAQLAKSIARAINANEDLTEAIALGHDLGHPPFGHSGEKMLSDKCEQSGLGKFRHNVHSLRVIDLIEKNGKGLNLCWEVREGILCHDGEVRQGEIIPCTDRSKKNVEDYEKEDYQKPASTLEGCIVKICDKIAYAGKDIEDAIEAGLLSRTDIPKECTDVLGDTNRKIIDTLVKDIVVNFERERRAFVDKNGREPEKHEVKIFLSPKVRKAMDDLIFDFNYKRIYLSDENLRYTRQTKAIVSGLFDAFLSELHELKIRSSEKNIFDFDPESKKGTEVQQRIFEMFLKFSLRELEEFRKKLEHDFSEGMLLGIFPDKDRKEIKASLDAYKLGEIKNMTKNEIEAAKMRILKDNIERGPHPISSVLSFLKGKTDEYLLNVNCAEITRDYIASLTDDLAISIFEKLHIPQSIV